MDSLALERALGTRREGLAKTKTVPSPIGGWNARDALANMKQTDAALMDNWFPEFGKVTVRNGYTAFASGCGSGDVSTLAEYHAGTVRKFLAGGSGSLWEITSGGAGVSLGSGFSNNRWQTKNFNGVLMLVNGSDHPQQWTGGSAVSSLAVSGSGLTTTNIIGVHPFKSRTYFWEDDAQDFWYSAVNTAGGALTKFPLSRVGQFGGNLKSVITWSRDAGDGMDDLIAFCMSSGEIVVYQGSNPGDSSAWALVGVFHGGSPIDPRGVLKLGGDAVIITRQGYLSLGRLLAEGQVSERTYVSDKIRGAVQEAMQSYDGNTGWEAVLYPRGSMALFNVPIGTMTFEQHVVNTATGAWCRFKDWDARCFGLFNNRLYFGGGAGEVYLADDGKSDVSASIEADCRQAFTDLGSGLKKKVNGLVPSMGGTGDLTISIGLDKDFQSAPLSHGIHTLATSGGGGDEAWEEISINWDEWGQAYSDAFALAQGMIGVAGQGYSLSARVKAQTTQSIEWYATTYIYEEGGLT